MKRELEFLKTFCETFVQEGTEWICSPFTDTGFLCATDAHILVRLKPDESFDLYGIENKAGKVKDELFVQNCSHDISVSDIREAISKIPVKDEDEMIDCPECKGRGQVTWEYGRHRKSDDCPDCDGEGEVSTGKILKSVKQYLDCYIKIKDGYFNGKYVERLIDICEFEQVDSVHLLKSNEFKNSCFKVGRFDVILMPMVVNKNEFNTGFDKTVIEINLQP